MPGWINVPVRIETKERMDKLKNNTKKSSDKLINELLDLADKVERKITLENKEVE